VQSETFNSWSARDLSLLKSQQYLVYFRGAGCGARRAKNNCRSFTPLRSALDDSVLEGRAASVAGAGGEDAAGLANPSAISQNRGTGHPAEQARERAWTAAHPVPYRVVHVTE
jgi:hypothetical protein